MPLYKAPAELCGWAPQVLHVPFYEWDELLGPHEKQHYLAQRLAAFAES